jgi:hypothetical protein
MKIACKNEDIATRVRVVLLHYGITRGVQQQDRKSGDPTIWVLVNGDIDPEDEPDIREEIEAILGATIQDESPSQS